MASIKRGSFPELERLKLLRRACTNSYWFLTSFLGYDRLTREFHEPMMRDMDLRDRRRIIVRDWRLKMNEKQPGLWPDLWPTDEEGKPLPAYQKDEAEIWARDHYKTTVFIGRCAKLILMYPDVAISAWHAVEEKIQETAQELGQLFVKNDDLRRLMPDLMPSKRAKRWLTATGFTMSRTKFNRHPTFYAKGAKSEVTGGHSDVGWLDDVIAQSTIDNSEMPMVRRWVGHTVTHVIRTDGGWKWGTGTRWAENDVYGSWIEGKGWDVRVRAALETDGAPDYKGKSVLYDIKWIKKKRDDPETNFPNQMMNDPEPETERPWGKDCEHFTGLSSTDSTPGVGGPGQIFVLSDPAPFLEGGYKSLSERARQDGTKDYWSICVVKLRVRGKALDLILMDGDYSQEWNYAEGCKRAVGFMNEYNTSKFFSENQKTYLQYMLTAAMPLGVSLTREKDGSPLKFDDYNKSDGKNSRMSELATWAREGRFWVCEETCSDNFLTGDGRFTGFLTQMQKYRKTGPNKNNLRFDDNADNVSRGTDTALQKFSPKPHIIQASQPFSPFRSYENEDEEVSNGSRYVSW